MTFEQILTRLDAFNSAAGRLFYRDLRMLSLIFGDSACLLIVHAIPVTVALYLSVLHLPGLLAILGRTFQHHLGHVCTELLFAFQQQIV